MTTLIDGLVPNQLWALVNRQTIAIGVLRRRPDTSPQARTSSPSASKSENCSHNSTFVVHTAGEKPDLGRYGHHPSP